jgi:type II secretory pathway predicted ATPase ExeA
MAGQNNLLDALCYRPALPLASRVVARSHLEGIHKQHMQLYLQHHLAIAGVTRCYFPRYSAATGMKICRAI